MIHLSTKTLLMISNTFHEHDLLCKLYPDVVISVVILIISVVLISVVLMSVVTLIPSTSTTSSASSILMSYYH